jgi:uncharacterized membrane protein YfcA
VIAAGLLLAASPLGAELGVHADARSGLRTTAAILAAIALPFLFGRPLAPGLRLGSRLSQFAGGAILGTVLTLVLAGFLDGLLGGAR